MTFFETQNTPFSRTVELIDAQKKVAGAQAASGAQSRSMSFCHEPGKRPIPLSRSTTFGDSMSRPLPVDSSLVAVNHSAVRSLGSNSEFVAQAQSNSAHANRFHQLHLQQQFAVPTVQEDQVTKFYDATTAARGFSTGGALNQKMDGNSLFVLNASMPRPKQYDYHAFVPSNASIVGENKPQASQVAREETKCALTPLTKLHQ